MSIQSPLTFSVRCLVGRSLLISIAERAIAATAPELRCSPGRSAVLKHDAFAQRGEVVDAIVGGAHLGQTGAVCEGLARRDQPAHQPGLFRHGPGEGLDRAKWPRGLDGTAAGSLRRPLRGAADHGEFGIGRRVDRPAQLRVQHLRGRRKACPAADRATASTSER